MTARRRDAEAGSRSLVQAAARGLLTWLIDPGLPGDAVQLVRTIRANADIAKVRLVMFTRRFVDAQHARDAGFDACPSKPVRQTVLSSA
jgi:DNA-binding response OmpR family regulator